MQQNPWRFHIYNAEPVGFSTVEQVTLYVLTMDEQNRQ